MRHYVYVLRNFAGRLYIGSTNNIERRLAEHQQGLYQYIKNTISIASYVGTSGRWRQPLDKTNPPPPAYVGFDMLTPVAILVVDELPEHNTGALIREISEFIFDDAAIVACLLRQWDVPTGIIGSAVGDDERGHNLARQLAAWGVQGQVRHTKEFSTPLEVDISDKTGARTYFWKRDPELLATLDTADLSLLQGARLLYVDWYDGDHILRAMDEAARLRSEEHTSELQ